MPSLATMLELWELSESMNGVKRLLIVEPCPGGHHFIPYLLFLARAAMARGMEVSLLTTRSATGHPAFQMLQASLPRELEVAFMPELPASGQGGVFGLLRGQWDYWKVVAAGYAALPPQARPDHVFVLSMDGLDRMVALRGSPFGRTPFSGLFVHLKFHWASLGIAPPGRLPMLQQWLFARLLAMPRVHALATIDASLPGWWQPRHPRHAAKLRHVPDPGHVRIHETRVQARAALGLDPEAFVVMVYGNISAAKNLAALLRAAALGGPSPVMLVAGQVADAECRACLASESALALQAAGRLRVFDQFVDLELEQRLFSAADVLWLGYARQVWGQSAVLAQAASAGRPVLAREGGWIGWMTRRHGLGLCVDPLDPDQVNAALAQLRPGQPAAEAAREAAARFADQRSEAAFAAAMLRCLPGA